jgi:hypothetical protein
LNVLDDDALTEMIADVVDLRQEALKLTQGTILTLQHDTQRDVSEQALDTLHVKIYNSMSSCSLEHSFHWRSLYTDLSIARAVIAIHPLRTTINAKLAVSQLDKAIVFAGAPGDGRLDLILDLIASIQSEHLSNDHRCSPSAEFTPFLLVPGHLPKLPTLLTSRDNVLCLQDPPAFTTFVSTLCKRPFVLKGFAKDWPALNERNWLSLDYLRSVAGRGRQVPVEVGSDYRTDDWTQRLMDWDDFLDALAYPTGTAEEGREVLYLAQHNLFKQFPALASGILEPDYVYASLAPSEDYPDYHPPANEEQLVKNVWLGPEGAVSPAHTVGPPLTSKNSWLMGM